jgi:hypothetical protein
MIASEATLPNEQPPHVYGDIMCSIYQSPRAEIPSIATFLSQGAAVGALLAFLSPVRGMLSHPENGYNFLLVYYLPVFLGGGMLFGLCEGVVLWAGTYLLSHRIHPIIRAILGPVLLVTLISIYAYLFAEPTPYDEEVSTTNYLLGIGIYAGCGVILGLVIGSRIRPFSELIRGATAERWPVMTALTGLALRLFVIFGLMVSILSLILSMQGDFQRSEFTMSVIAVSHFGVAVLIIFARTPFWLLLPLALIINSPIAALITDVLKPDELFVRTITLNYLALWGGFLLCRASVPREALDFIKREARYYFIE